MRARDSLRRVPRPLALLLPVVLICSTIWTFWDPPWAVIDEPSHFGYAESIAENGSKPNRGPTVKVADGGRTRTVGTFITTSQSRLLLQAANSEPIAFNLYARPAWGESAERRYNRIAREGRRDDGGQTSGATSYPPLYYAIEAVPYLAAGGGTALDRLFLMRWISGLWMLVAAVGGWLLAGEVFNRRRRLQLVSAATLGLWPMIDFVSAGVNPEGMLVALCALALWQIVRVAKRGPALWPCLALAATVLAATLAKVSGAALAPAALFAVAASARPARERLGDRVLPLVAFAAVLLIVPAAILLAGHAVGVLPGQLDSLVSFRIDRPREFISYLWQFYFPKLWFMQPRRLHFPVISDLPLYNIWFGTSWGTFGFVDVWFPKWVYETYFAVAMVVLAGAAATVIRAVRAHVTAATTGSVVAAIALSLATLGVLAGVHLQDYSNAVNGGPAFAQGRYLFPVAGIGALAVAAAVKALPARVQDLAAGGWLGFMIILQVASFALLATRFYA